MYEHRTHPLLAWSVFLRRAARHAAWALVILLCAVGIGTVGYRALGHFGWIDAFLNATMILTGMGPVDRLQTTPAKLFAAAYALVSSLIFIAVIGVALTPWVHRLVHWMHLDENA